MTSKSSIFKGLLVDIILKKDQKTGKTTRGIVEDILTNSQNHPRGIKVRLQNGQVGRVATIIGNGVDGDRKGGGERSNVVDLRKGKSNLMPNESDSKPEGILLSDYIQQKLNKAEKDWNCRQCTFLNSKFLKNCEICSTPR